MDSSERLISALIYTVYSYLAANFFVTSTVIDQRRANAAEEGQPDVGRLGANEV